MKFFDAVRSLASPKKAHFIKWLRSKRLTYATDILFADAAPTGTLQGTLRSTGLHAVEHIASPDATIATVLECLNRPHIRWFYLDTKFGAASWISHNIDWACPKGPENTRALIRALEYAVTGSNNAVARVPDSIETLPDYLRYRLAVEHRADPLHFRREYGFSDEFFLTAISESVHFFK